ncbi:histidine phosphatase family protein [Bacillus salacetis]|uniref:histidine phosphatase family protein n=1 Tax=Bacillus salacetis TaxID=2315464 RepID=UPI003BA3A091
MDGSMAIGLYRHAVTEENLARQYVGWHDAPLVIAESLRLKEIAGRYPEYDLVFTSDLRRCRYTADLLFQDTPIIESPLLREIHFGEWETKTYEELQGKRVYRNWLEDQSLPIPGGESLGVFEERLEQFWSNLFSDSHAPEVAANYIHRKHKDLRIAFVTHGGVIRYFLSKWVAETKAFWEWKIPFAEGYELHWTAEEWREKSRCSSLLEVPSTESPGG